MIFILLNYLKNVRVMIKLLIYYSKCFKIDIINDFEN